MIARVHYSHLPTDFSVVHVGLIKGVTNAVELRSRIVAAAAMEGPEGEAAREAVNFAFIDARLITSVLHLQTAIYQAILAESQGALRTKTIHSEILWALNPSNNISEAIRRYGVADTSTNVLVVRITSPELQDVGDRMLSVVSGTISPLEDLAGITDWASIRKLHKLNNEPAIKNAKGETEVHRIVEEIVISTVAMKSVQ